MSMLKAFKDGFQPGLQLLSDSTIVAHDLCKPRKEQVGCSIVSVRFKMSEVDAVVATAIK
jgi:hypothetical protein